MLFMMICTWDPQDEREVRTKRANWEWPKEVRVISEYFDLQGCRTIYVVDCDAVGSSPAAQPGSISFCSKSSPSGPSEQPRNW